MSRLFNYKGGEDGSCPTSLCTEKTEIIDELTVAYSGYDDWQVTGIVNETNSGAFDGTEFDITVPVLKVLKAVSIDVTVGAIKYRNSTSSQLIEYTRYRSVYTRSSGDFIRYESTKDVVLVPYKPASVTRNRIELIPKIPMPSASVNLDR